MVLASKVMRILNYLVHKREVICGDFSRVKNI